MADEGDEPVVALRGRSAPDGRRSRSIHASRRVDGSSERSRIRGREDPDDAVHDRGRGVLGTGALAAAHRVARDEAREVARRRRRRRDLGDDGALHARRVRHDGPGRRGERPRDDVGDRRDRRARRRRGRRRATASSRSSAAREAPTLGGRAERRRRRGPSPVTASQRAPRPARSTCRSGRSRRRRPAAAQPRARSSRSVSAPSRYTCVDRRRAPARCGSAARTRTTRGHRARRPGSRWRTSAARARGPSARAASAGKTRAQVLGGGEQDADEVLGRRRRCGRGARRGGARSRRARPRACPRPPRSPRGPREPCIALLAIVRTRAAPRRQATRTRSSHGAAALGLRAASESARTSSWRELARAPRAAAVRARPARPARGPAARTGSPTAASMRRTSRLRPSVITTRDGPRSPRASTIRAGRARARDRPRARRPRGARQLLRRRAPLAPRRGTPSRPRSADASAGSPARRRS